MWFKMRKILFLFVTEHTSPQNSTKKSRSLYRVAQMADFTAANHLNLLMFLLQKG